ncbi:head-tail connector protein [uncultured Mediterranean phage uvDeep-CGR2-AD3-C191]|nr:head-tail connector protein [uncultured Mediterranean phage uvDeep-CGR2-AD3-C191]
MPKANPVEIKKRYARLKGIKQNWESDWQSIAEYVLPRKGVINISRSRGQEQTERLFDSTAVHSLELLASSMHGSLTSSAYKWFSLKVREEYLNENFQIRTWLEECSKRMYLAFRQSNFNQEIHEAYLDVVAFGTASIMVEERPGEFPFNGLLFRSIPLNEYVIEENAQGKVDTLFREFKISVRACEQMFGVQSFTDSLRKKLEENQDEHITVLHAVFERAPDEVDEKSLPWASIYILAEEDHLLRESGYHEFCYAVPRWSKTSGEIYGRSPSHTGLPDIKTLNKCTELQLKALAKTIDPPVLVQDDGVLGNIRLVPSGITVVRDASAITPFRIEPRWDISTLKTNELRENVRRIYYADQLQMPQGPQMTATEVNVRYELMQRLLGPTLGRLESELLNPLIERTFQLMMRAGQFSPPPMELVEFATQQGGSIDIEYEGPLAKSQRQVEVMAFQRTLEMAMPLSQIDQSILDNLNLDAAVRHIALVSGVPANLLRAEEEIAQMREQRAQAAQAQAEQQQMLDESTAMKNMAGPMRVLDESDIGKALTGMGEPGGEELPPELAEELGPAMDTELPPEMEEELVAMGEEEE